MHIYGHFGVEKATLKDVPTLAMLEYKLYEETGQKLDEPGKAALLKDLMSAIGYNPNMLVMVLTITRRRKRRVVGMAAARIMLNGMEIVAVGGSLYVIPQFRGTEASEVLFDAMEKRVIADYDVDRIITDTNNPLVVNMLTKHGYEQTKVVFSKKVR